MMVSMNELARARELVDRVLKELCLETYLFEVEPQDDGWGVTIECAVSDGWQRCQLTAAKEQLLRAAAEDHAYGMLLDEWRGALSECKRRL